MKEKVYIELYNEDTEESIEVGVECDFYVEPTEYEGGYVFYQGGIVLDDYVFDKFEFEGINYEASRDFPTDLIKYVVGINEKTTLEDVIEKAFENIESNYEVPSRHYPASWR